MGLVPTVRTGESVTLSYATQPATRAILTGVGRIHVIHQQAVPLSGVRHASSHQAALPLTQTAASAFPHPQLFGGLRESQALEHQHRVSRRPLNQLGGGLLTE